MIKTADEIIKMRCASKLAANVLEMISEYVKPGISTAELNSICQTYIENDLDAIPSTLNHHGFPACICTSLNHVVCHGIPSAKKILKQGDILNIDVTVKKDGFIGDTSKMFLIGEVKHFAKQLVNVAWECMMLGIAEVKPGNYIGDIAYAITNHANQFRYTVVREYGGHGIGQKMWEKPQVSHVGQAKTGLQLQPGMTFTIEPMINQGKANIKHLSDGWTVVTKDHKLSAQWEHTVLVTENGVEILTLREEEKSNLSTFLN